jgi:hypothetical protein
MERDPISDFGPGRPAGGGLDDDAAEQGADADAPPTYEEEVEAERTGTSGSTTGGMDSRDDVLTDALDEERNPDPTERR